MYTWNYRYTLLLNQIKNTTPVLVVEGAGIPGENHHGQSTCKPYHLWLRVEWYLKKKLEYGEEVLWVKSLYLEKKMVSGEETSIWG